MRHECLFLLSFVDLVMLVHVPKDARAFQHHDKAVFLISKVYSPRTFVVGLHCVELMMQTGRKCKLFSPS